MNEKVLVRTVVMVKELQTFSNKFEYYDYFRDKLQSNNIKVSDYKKINYGLQFKVEINNQTELVRIYESKKKGIKNDFSQVKSEENKKLILSILSGSIPLKTQDEIEQSQDKKELKSDSVLENFDEDEKALIGTDESGKGDFFGPLVVAAVYADENTQKILRVLGVDDSKKLNDNRIIVLADEIKKLCKYSVVCIGNEKYNELYKKIGNLNKLLAWGHARVIENVLEEVECKNALSDQFGNPKLIENALMKKGRKINLDQRPRAEENVVVAAASILARAEFVKKIKSMCIKYGLEFTKGVSNKTILVGKMFVQKYGKDRLKEVSKLHFKTTDKLI
ncbi:ribonuclease HIII [Haloimpatiens sp. FM7330]|uniref:ribonuclease HIII n=1 Tax=Haloimpatiens sp. FM7330 TaxID=3298610 RepID=UPI00363F428D